MFVVLLMMAPSYLEVGASGKPGAVHIYEAIKHEKRLSHLVNRLELPKSINLQEVGICVLHLYKIWSLENIAGAPPTDIVFGFPQFRSDFATLNNQISFDLPIVGEKVQSVGYCNFRYPENGIPLADVRNGVFDWKNDYSHNLRVVEGSVKRVFTQKFASGYIDGPCFMFDSQIEHGQSGGPILSSSGSVVGLNSGSADSFFDHHASIGSLLYPTLFTNLKFGMQMGPVRMNASRPLLDLISEKIVTTDGSEMRISFSQSDNGQIYVNPRTPVSMSEFVHDDFSGFQTKRSATIQSGQIFTLKKTQT